MFNMALTAAVTKVEKCLPLLLYAKYRRFFYLQRRPFLENEVGMGKDIGTHKVLYLSDHSCIACGMAGVLAVAGCFALRHPQHL